MLSKFISAIVFVLSISFLPVSQAYVTGLPDFTVLAEKQGRGTDRR